jgi:hypothetical protein
MSSLSGINMDATNWDITGIMIGFFLVVPFDIPWKHRGQAEHDGMGESTSRLFEYKEDFAVLL